MAFLILAILSSFTVSVLVKIYQLQGLNTQVFVASNYIVAAAIGWVIAVVNGIPSISPLTVLIGLGGGVLWPGGLYIMTYAIKHYGLSLTGPIRRLSLVVPVAFGLIALDERLTLPVVLGILLTVAAFFTLRPVDPEDASNIDKRALWFFPFMILYYGVVDLWVNIYNTYGDEGERFVFLTLIFTFAGVFAWGVVLFQRLEVRREAFLKGLGLGLPNIFTTFFLLAAIRHPAFADITSVAYTLYAVVGVTLAFSAGVVIWKEPVNKWSYAGVALAIAAIALLNLGA
jgi:drug/metabolite transporter (DMT)-like permease